MYEEMIGCGSNESDVCNLSRELYEKVPWFDRRYNYRFISDIQKELVKWTSGFVRRHKEAPFDYNYEAQMVGHFAIAADQARKITLQEYPYPDSDDRADLLIRHGRKAHKDCVFEFKRRRARVINPRFNYQTDFKNSLEDYDRAFEQLSEHASKVAAYKCAAVGMITYVDSREDIFVPGAGLMTERQKRDFYYELFDRAYSSLARMIKSARSTYSYTEETSAKPPNFYWAYALKHKFAQYESERAIRCGRDDFAVGMFWVGGIYKTHNS